MTTPRDLIAASSPSYEGLMLGHADEILQRLKTAGYVVVKLDDPDLSERLVRTVFNKRYPSSGRHFLHELGVRSSVRIVLAALGEPVAKETP